MQEVPTSQHDLVVLSFSPKDNYAKGERMRGDEFLCEVGGRAGASCGLGFHSPGQSRPPAS
jgi:hypothetical protein